MLTTTTKRQASLEKTIRGRLSEAELARVKFLLPADLFAFLQEIEINELNKENTIKGYKVKTSYSAVASSDVSHRREAVSRVVASAVRRLHERNVSRK